jgi:phage major head subunit gpT-like protein
MLINQGNLQSLTTGFKTAFQTGLDNQSERMDYSPLVTEVMSQTASEEYGWLNHIPSIREWLGDRIIHQMTVSGYTLKNQHFEQTISIKRDDIEDDRYGVYGSVFKMMGEEVARFPNRYVFELLQKGWQQKGFDGKAFFSTDHPRLNENGKVVTYANTDNGTSTPWFLVDASRMLKPLLYQVRKPFSLTQLDDPEDEQVFMRGEYIYGVDGRVAFGYGLPFLAWGSKQALSDTTFNNAISSMMNVKGDYNRTLGLRPTHLIVPPSLRKEALSIVKAETLQNGQTNINHNAVDVIVSPWLE